LQIAAVKLDNLDETTRAACWRWLAELPDGTVVQPLATKVVFEHMTLAMSTPVRR
jgi:hypothetical protein